MLVWIAFICLLVTGIAGVIIVLINSGSQMAEKVKKEQAHNGVVRNISNNAHTFAGLYEAIYMINKGTLRDTASVFADWGERVENLENVPGLLSFWNESFANHESWNRNESMIKAGELLALIHEAGVKRSEETKVTVGNDTLQYYDFKDEISIEPGSSATVDFPYWIHNGSVLEKGEISMS